jgi:hypothetical protein
MPVGKRVELMHRPLGMNPAQCMLSDIELSGIIAEHDSVAEEFMRLDAPHRAPSVATRTGSGVTSSLVKPSRSRYATHVA